ncbi:MAG: peptide chain release factor 2 [Candidatus Saccharimonadales bacterium]
MGSLSEVFQRADQLNRALKDALQKIGFEDLESRKNKLDDEASNPDLWQDSERAQTVMREQSQLDKHLQPWQNLRRSVLEIMELAAMNDETVLEGLEDQLEKTQSTFDDLKEELKFNGPYDNHNVILGLYAGAGGTDAQDWTAMLLRMYVRYAEKAGWAVNTIDESAGEEAGIKSITLEISGPFAYGKLKGEQGVHRLVRLSPFNAESRETSFAKVEIAPKIDQPEELEIDEKELKIDVYRSGGHGGQSVNTTDSAVRVTHLPTGIVVAIQNERSQLQNKETAMSILRSKLAQLQIEQHAEKVSELKGPNEQAAWGNQIRNYVLHPYKQVKDLRTEYTSSDPDKVLDGDLEPFIAAYLIHTLGA